MPDDEIDVVAFASAYRRLAEAVARVGGDEGPFAQLLRDHLRRDAGELPVVAMGVDAFDHANLQLALNALAAEPDVEVARTVGVRGQSRMFGNNLNLGMLTMRVYGLDIGPVDYVELPIDNSDSLTCIDFGLLLLRVEGEPVAMLIRSVDDHRGGGISAEVMTADRAAAADLIARIRSLMAAHNMFRRKVVTLAPAGMMGGSISATFIDRPQLQRDAVILPQGVLEQVERLTIQFSERAASLRAGGRHLRRGILLHGAPGTGKTHTVRYLMSRLTDRTVFVLSGQGLGIIGKTVGLARALQPAIVVLEDVDLIAEERTMPHAGTNPILFELLNQMDGVEDDADIVFLLTTNRPDLLEPALASRPGRVDLAVEIPMPAATERRRLLELYATGLRADNPDWDAIVDRTEGSSAAFLRELLREAALDGASADGQAPVITTDLLLGALASMAHADQAMTARLMGMNR